MNAIKPSHYQTVFGDLFDEWHAIYSPEIFDAVMRCIAQRYVVRHKRKNGREDLLKARYTLIRLNEYDGFDARDDIRKIDEMVWEYGKPICD